MDHRGEAAPVSAPSQTAINQVRVAVTGPVLLVPHAVLLSPRVQEADGIRAKWSPAVTIKSNPRLTASCHLILTLLVSIGNHHHDYQHSHLDLSMLTPKLGKNSRKAEAELA